MAKSWRDYEREKMGNSSVSTTSGATDWRAIEKSKGALGVTTAMQPVQNGQATSVSTPTKVKSASDFGTKVKNYLPDTQAYDYNATRQKERAKYEAPASNFDGSTYTGEDIKIPFITIGDNAKAIAKYVSNDEYRKEQQERFTNVSEQEMDDYLEYDKYLTDTEKNTIKYYASIGDFDSVKKYAKFLRDDINQRQGQARSEEILGIENDFVQGVNTTMDAMGGGVARSATGLKQVVSRALGNKDPIAKGIMEYAQQYERQEIDGLQGVLADTGTSVGQMLPSIGLNALTGGIGGTALFGASVAGSAYNDTRREGYSDAQSLEYATTTGLLEAGLQKALGGIGGLGSGTAWKSLGKTTAGQALTKAVGTFATKPIGRAIGKYALDMGSEGLEEYIQDVLDPIVRWGILKEDFETSPFSLEYYTDPDKLYSAFLGALTAGFMNAPDAVSRTVATNKRGKMFNETEGGADEVILSGIDSGEDTYSYKLAEMLFEKQANGEKVSNYDLGTLYNANIEAVEAENRQAQVDDISLVLMESGMEGENIGRVADIMQRAFSGDHLTNTEAETIINNESAKALFEEQTGIKIPDGSLSTKRKAVKSFSMEVVKGRANPIEYTIPVQEATETATAQPISNEMPLSKVNTLPNVETATEGEIQANTGNATIPYNVLQNPIISQQAVDIESEYNKYGEKGKQAVLKNMQTSKDINAFKDFETFYRAGAIGLPIEQVSGRNALSSDVAFAAYSAGQNDTAVSKTKYEAKKVVVNKNAGLDKESSKHLKYKEKRTLESLGKALGVRIRFADDIKGSNAEYNMKTGEIVISKKAENPWDVVTSHEIVHRLRQTSPEEFYKLAEAVLQYHETNSQFDTEADIARYSRLYGLKEGSIEYYNMLEEIVADFISKEANANDLAEMLSKEPTLLDRFIEILENIIEAFNNLIGRGNDADDIPNDAVKHILSLLDVTVRASELRIANGIDTVDADATIEVGTEDSKRLSVKSFGEASGFTVSKETDGRIRFFDKNGKEIDKVTLQHMKESPIGVTMQYATSLMAEGDAKDAKIKENEAQLQFLADLNNLILKTGNFTMAYEFVGSTVFSSIKTNADNQYTTSVDFPSVCRKTQTLISAMSKAMVDKKRGLTKQEIIDLYRATVANGQAVPCPQCYVFTRWIGAGNKLEQIYKYQNKYANYTKAELEAESRRADKAIAEFADLKGKTKGEARADLIARLRRDLSKMYKEDSKATQAEIDEVAEELFRIECATWLRKVRLQDNYKPVPSDILFDLDRANEFADNYPDAWTFRNSGGASEGKSITPYADARFGEFIKSVASASYGKTERRLENNPFTTANIVKDKKGNLTLNKQGQKDIATAIVNAQKQNLRGGYRWQSFSDFRYEYATDYIITAIEMNIIGAYCQTYTKVPEALDFFGAMGVSANCSYIPIGKGYDSNGNLLDSKVNGISPKAAEYAINKYDTIGNITIGNNDTHITKMLDSEDRHFVIPWHASGGIDIVIEEMNKATDGIAEMDDMEDYTPYQSEKILPKGVVGAKAYAEAKKYRELRVAILTGGKLTSEQMALIKADKSGVFQRMYDNFHTNEDSICYGVKMTSGQVGSVDSPTILPFEYFDTNTTYETSYKSRDNYLAYCELMGLKPKFNGMKIEDGKLVQGKNKKGEPMVDHTQNPNYWKLLIDRRMYGNDGKYVAQKVVSLAGVDIENHLNPYQQRKIHKEAMAIAPDKAKVDKIVEDAGLRKSVKDSEYLALAQNPEANEAELQKMVEEAAREAGYDSPILYHGTNAFGFTKLDVSHSDDEISFFVTDSEEIAYTYSNTNNTRRLSEEIDEDSAEELREFAMSGVMDVADSMFYAIERVFPYTLDYSDTMSYVYKKAEELEDGYITSEEMDDEVYSYYTEIVEERWEADDEYEDYYDWWDSSEEANKIMNSINNVIESIKIFVNSRSSGNYAFYGNTKNLLEIDAEGKQWDKITSNKLPDITSKENKKYGYRNHWDVWSTRSIARYAKDSGYDGVYISNVFDDGGKSFERQRNAGNVYIFFNPQAQLKSADPVTYDSKGDVIPLSKRFDENETDIRYSRINYHAGDLGKAESRANQSGGRHTGHFGTGTYFVSNKKELSYGYSHRPVEEVDFDNYKLFRPLYAGQGHDLHTALSVVNNLFGDIAHWIELGENRWEIDREYGDLLYDYEVNISEENAERIDRFLLDKGIMTEERLEHEKSQRREYPLWYTYEEIEKEYFGRDGEIDIKYDKARKAAWELKFIFDKSEEEIIDRINKAKAEVDNSDVPANKRDSYSTAFMKGLGYEGIDVSGYPSLDNTTYGSVIYDLKGKDLERKNEIGTARYSKKGSADIIKENAQLKEINEALRREFTITDFRGVDEKKVAKYAGSLLKDYSSKYDKAELATQLKSVYDYMQGVEGEASFEEAMSRLEDIARNILGKSVAINDDDYNEYVDLRKDLRTTGVTLADKYKADIPDFADFRKRNWGKVKIINDGTPVDVKYQALSEAYPWLFPEDITHPADQLRQMVEVANDLRPFQYNPYEDGIEYTARVLASEMFDGFFEVPQQKKTFADKQQEKLFKERTKRTILEEKNKTAKEMIADLKYTLRWKDAETNYLLDSMKGRQAEQISKLKKKYEDKAQRKEDNLNRREKIEKIKKFYNDLATTYDKPTPEKHIPEDLKPMVAKFLSAFDFTTPRQSVDTILRLNDMKQYFEVEALKGGADDINPVAAEMVDLLDIFIKTMPKKPIHKQDKDDIAGQDYLSNTDIETLYKITKIVKTIIRNYDQILAGNIKARRSEMGERIIDFHKGASTKEVVIAKEKVKNFFNFDLANAYTFADQMGGAYKELFANLDAGYDKLINNIDTAKSYMDKARKDAGIDDKVLETMTGESAKIYSFKVSSGQTLKLTKPQVMFLYLSSKREQALNHILGGGITPKPIVTKVKGADGKYKFKRKLTQTEPVKMKIEDVQAVIGTLTDKEKAFADSISKFLNTTTSDWGNEVSMAMYGYKRFTEKNYIGIMSDKNYLDANYGTTYEPSLTGKGWTKQINEKATNPIVMDDLFSYFAGFTNEIAIYNALALPTADIKAVMNYQSKDPVSPNFGKSVKQAVNNNLGEGAMRFFKQLMIDVNGGLQKDVATNLGRKLLGMNKAAVIGLSLSSTLQQPTAILRATVYIDSKYLTKGMSMKGDFDKVIKYSNIAKWKSFGYFGNDMGQSVTDLILGKKRKGGAYFKPMELADNFTWSKLWNACELEIQDTNPSLTKGSDDYYRAVASRFDFIVKNSQVVDTVLKRTQIMRSNSDFNRLYTSFMGEPLENVNMLMRAGNAYMKDKSPMNKRFLAKTVSAILLSQTAAAIAKAIAQTITGKKEDEEFLEKVWNNLSGDLTGMIPYVDSIASALLTGEAPSNLVWQGCINLNKAIKSTKDLFNPDSKNTALQNIKTAVSASGMAFGIPTNNIIGQVEGFAKFLGNSAFGAKGRYLAMKATTNINNSDNRTKFMDCLFEAWQDGDTDAIAYIKADMMKNGITNEYIQTAFKTKQRKWLRGQKDIQKVAKLVKAYNSKDEAKRDLNERAEIIAQMNELASKYAEEGYSEDIVIAAIKEQAKK